jgi:hypothetical protein
MRLSDILIATILTATWEARPASERVQYYNLYEQVSGTWIWRASPTAPPFKFSANRGTRTYGMTSVSDTGESQRSTSVSVRVKH